MKIRYICLFLILLSVFSLFASCGKNQNENVTNQYAYNPVSETDSALTTDSSETTDAESGSSQSFSIDTSWMKNYHASYSYYNPEISAAIMNIEEFRTETDFLENYTDNGTQLYYSAGEGGVDFYSVITGEAKQAHSLLKDKRFSELSSLFMKLSAVDGTFWQLPNVLFVSEETVAGRPCYKYIQRAYSDKEVTDTAYLWIDSQFGFAAKCTLTDSKGDITVSWELKEFSQGSVTKEQASLDISKYTFTEE